MKNIEIKKNILTFIFSIKMIFVKIVFFKIKVQYKNTLFDKFKIFFGLHTKIVCVEEHFFF